MQKWCTFKEVNPIIGYRLTGDVLNVIILKQRDGGGDVEISNEPYIPKKSFGKKRKK
jgi:hypothetical protein